MNSAIICLISLIIAAAGLWKLYSWRFLLHPSIWFLTIWILSLLSFFIVTNNSVIDIVFEEELLDELFNYISFTAISILVVSLVTFRKQSMQPIKFSVVYDLGYLKWISWILLATSAIKLFSVGFDLALNREIMITTTERASGESSVSPLVFVTNLILFFNAPVLLLSSYEIGKRVVFSKKLIGFLFFPFLTDVLNTLSIGGRSGIVNSAVIFFVGFVFAVLKYGHGYYREYLMVLFRFAFLFFLVFSVYATSINVLRDNASGKDGGITSRWEDLGYLRHFSGVIEYMVAHYPGYQLRRVDSVTEELEYGQISFSGLTMLEVPFLSQLSGFSFSIQNLFDLKDPTRVKSVFEEDGLEWSNTTSTVYRLLFDDFGYYGTFAVIFFFVIYTQLVFSKILSYSGSSIILLFQLFIIHFLWANSIFSHHIKGNWMGNILFAFLVLHLFFLQIKKHHN